jgi:hypothetical protein
LVEAAHPISGVILANARIHAAGLVGVLEEVPTPEAPAEWILGLRPG